MTMSDGYPDIDFLDTNPEAILSEMIAGFEEMTQRTLYPASPERLFIAWCAAIVVQQRVIINEVAKMNIPRYARGKNLDSLAELFRDTERLPASRAMTTIRCYISKEQEESVFVPKGTRVTADGKTMFSTTELLEIPAGQLYGDVEAECMEAGEIGNEYLPGQLKEVVDVYDYYQKIENITETRGGAEEEDDESYYRRMREGLESFSTAGPEKGYKYWAKKASSAVADVEVESPKARVVDVRILLQDGKIPTETMLEEINDKLSASDVRPMTDKVLVSAPDAIGFSVDVTYYIDRADQERATEIAKAQQEAVDDYIAWQTAKMGRDINPSRLIKMMVDAGAKRVEVRNPEFAKIKRIEVGKLESRNVLNGGLEDE